MSSKGEDEQTQERSMENANPEQGDFKSEKGQQATALHQPWTEDELRAVLPLLAEDANKYSRGVLTVIAGSARYPGAACLASRAGQRAGAGYTELVTNKSTGRLALGAYPSLVVHDVEVFDLDALASQGKPKRAICIGPGFEPGSEPADKLVVKVLKKAQCPVLVDGGGLGALGSKKARKVLAARKASGRVTVITPHGGEARRLAASLGLGLGVKADGLGERGGASWEPCDLSAALSLATGAVVVLKGPDTYIAQGNQVHPMYEGTPALAKAGTGDVLAGIIASLLAQGADPFAAAVLGATLHARAGIAAAQAYADASVTPEDLLETIPAAIRSLAEVE